jgi:hypothetical protein
LTRPGPSFIDASRSRNSCSRDGTIGARTMKLDCGVMTFFELIEDFGSRRLVVRDLGHRMAKC